MVTVNTFQIGPRDPTGHKFPTTCLSPASTAKYTIASYTFRSSHIITNPSLTKVHTCPSLFHPHHVLRHSSQPRQHGDSRLDPQRPPNITAPHPKALPSLAHFRLGGLPRPRRERNPRPPPVRRHDSPRRQPLRHRHRGHDLARVIGQHAQVDRVHARRHRLPRVAGAGPLEAESQGGA